MVLCHGMTSRVALVMAPLLPRIRPDVGNMGLENGRGFKEGRGGEKKHFFDAGIIDYYILTKFELSIK